MRYVRAVSKSRGEEGLDGDCDILVIVILYISLVYFCLR